MARWTRFRLLHVQKTVKLQTSTLVLFELNQTFFPACPAVEDLSAVHCCPECIGVLVCVCVCVICCAVFVSDDKTRVGHFITSYVISCSPLLPLPTQHKRPLPDRNKCNICCLSHLSSIFLSIASSLLLLSTGENVFPDLRSSSILTFSAFLASALWFSSVSEDCLSTVVLTELLLCPRSTKSLILNTPRQFLSLWETNVHRRVHSPLSVCPLAAWNSVPFAFEVLRAEWRFFAW